MAHKHKMHPLWAAWWYTYILAFTLCNMTAPGLPPWTWYVVFGVFLVPEAFGAAIKNRFGDTLSESVWTFAQAGIARKVFAGALGIALAFRAWTLFDITSTYMGVTEVALASRLPWDITMLGLAIWLLIHLFTLGRYG